MAKSYILPFVLIAAMTASSCGPLIKEVFQRPKVRVTEVLFVSDPVHEPKGPWELLLALDIDNPNGYPVIVSNVAHTMLIGREIVSDGDYQNEVRIEANSITQVQVPIAIRPDAFREALRQVLQAKRLDYEFNGSVGLRVPVAGVVHIPFSKTGNFDAADLLKKGLRFN